MMKQLLFWGLLGLLLSSPTLLRAQHEMHMHDSAAHKMPMKKMDIGYMDMGNMGHAFSLNLPMNRNGSGTSWLPDATPMYGVMKHSHGWMFMFHGNVFVRYNNQDIGRVGYFRGSDKWDAPNMLMAMGQRKVGEKGLFHFNVMLSLDAAIAGGSGYPLLFQTGESWKGKPLVDRQHPHDLFSELSVSYAYAFNKKTDLFVYLGYPGEPALGPVTFMHRPSGWDNPDAPIGHHWTDATHITFGVATVGLRKGKFKVEASSFTGREPDEDRYNFDKPRFDSWSGRLSFNPSSNWAMQVSHGFIKSPEALHAGEDVHRTTASATYSLPLGRESWVNATALWGLNAIKDEAGSSDGQLEVALRKRKGVAYFRYEIVQKSSEELNVAPLYGGALFLIHATTLGAGRDLFHMGPIRTMLGGQLTWYHQDSRLNGLYGSNPLAMEVYLRFYPGLMRM